MSRIFEHFNDLTDCPICGSNHDGQAVLVPADNEIRSKNEPGPRCVEAKQVHLDCLLSSLRYIKFDSIQDWIMCYASQPTSRDEGQGQTGA